MIKKTFIRIRSQESEINRIEFLDCTPYYGASYYYPKGNTTRNWLLKKTTWFLYDSFYDKKYIKAEDLLHDLEKKFPGLYMIKSGRIYHRPTISIFTDNKDSRLIVRKNTVEELHNFLNELSLITDLSGMFSEESGKPESIREFIVRLESLNYE